MRIWLKWNQLLSCRDSSGRESDPDSLNTRSDSQLESKHKLCMFDIFTKNKNQVFYFQVKSCSMEYYCSKTLRHFSLVLDTGACLRIWVTHWVLCYSWSHLFTAARALMTVCVSRLRDDDPSPKSWTSDSVRSLLSAPGSQTWSHVSFKTELRSIKDPLSDRVRSSSDDSCVWWSSS